jgi:hypothetical protein
LRDSLPVYFTNVSSYADQLVALVATFISAVEPSSARGVR